MAVGKTFWYYFAHVVCCLDDGWNTLKSTLIWSLRLYSMKSSPPDASESDSLQLEGTVKYQPNVVQLMYLIFIHYIHQKFRSFYLTSS